LLFTLRVKAGAQVQRLGLDFYEREMSGRILTRMTTDVDALSTFLQTGLVTMVSSVLTFFGVLAALLIINLQLGLAVLCIFPVLAAATLVFRSKSSRAYNESRERVGADRGRAHRLPALHRHAVLPGPAAVPGLRRLPAGHGGAAPDHRPAQAGHLHAAAAPAGRRGPAGRPDRAARRRLQLRQQRRQ